MRRPKALKLPPLTVLLAVTTVTASVGWFVSAWEGRGVPPECYRLRAERVLEFDTTHGQATTRATIAVEEARDKVMVGYWEEVESGAHMAVAHQARVTYGLRYRLEDRLVVDPAGDPIPEC